MPTLKPAKLQRIVPNPWSHKLFWLNSVSHEIKRKDTRRRKSERDLKKEGGVLEEEGYSQNTLNT